MLENIKNHFALTACWIAVICIPIIAQASDLADSLIVEYNFSEGGGVVVGDSSSSGSPLDLTIADPDHVEWLQCGGLRVKEPTIIASSHLASDLSQQIQNSGELTLEAWIKPDARQQFGPARIVSLSKNTVRRNVTLGQSGANYNVRFRTTATGLNGLHPSTSTWWNSVRTQLTHVVYTRDDNGWSKIFVNGKLKGIQRIPGNTNNWNHDYKLALANELGGNREWLGEFHRVSIYNKALKKHDIFQQFELGLAQTCNVLPEPAFALNTTIGEAPLTVQFDASNSSDADGEIISYSWDFGNNHFSSGSLVSHTYTEPGHYTATLTVTDNSGDTANISRDIHVLANTGTGRVSENQQLLYTFTEGDGNTIYNQSGIPGPSLVIDNPENTEWQSCSGLLINDEAALISEQPVSQFVSAVKVQNEVTFEAWVVPASDSIVDAQKLMTISNGGYFPNISVAQVGSEFAGRVRTSTDIFAWWSLLFTNNQSVEKRLTHITYTIDSDRNAKMYVNGQLAKSRRISGRLNNWSEDYKLALANEIGLDRAWSGEFHLAALYDRALTADEIVQNYQAGVIASCNNPPVAEFTLNKSSGLVPFTINVDASDTYDQQGDSLTYAWDFGDGTLAEGITASHEYLAEGTYTITLTVTDSANESSTRSKMVQVYTVGSPVQLPGLQALYNFQEGAGNTVNDVSNVGMPLDLTIQNTTSTSWLECGGLSIDSSSIIRSALPAEKLSHAFAQTNALSMEAWIRSDNIYQRGPVATISNSSGQRNLTLDQRKKRFLARIRSTTNPGKANQRKLFTRRGAVSSELTHVAITRDDETRTAKIYLDGQLVKQRSLSGTFSNWDDDFQLAIANDVDGGAPWLGDIHRLAFYDRALNPDEVLLLQSIGIEDGCAQNNDPVITSEASLEAVVNEVYAYQVQAVDPDNDIINFNLLTAPTGMTIDNVSGLLQWTPTEFGQYDVVIQATDIRGGVTSQSYTLSVIVTSNDRDGDGFLNENDAFPDDPTEWSDIDGDGIGDNTDPDRDGDGVNNDQDAFPNNPNETSDLDGDGLGDNEDPDRDDDGVLDDVDLFPNDPNEAFDADLDGIGDNADPDDDNDGTPDVDDAFPFDPTECCDLDSDGIGDNSDTDRDGDGISNDDEIQLGFDPNDPASTPPDLDTDGIPDALDDDRDGDGFANNDDAFPDDPTEWSDLDGNGVGDNSDTDRDGDGYDNTLEEQYGGDPDNASITPPDLDGDFIPDAIDDDRDGDGISNDHEIQLGTDPDNAADTPADQDGDSIPDALDDDRDGDGVDNNLDAFPDDPLESSDLDGDGIGDNSDTDRDGDNYDNTIEEQLGSDPNDAASTPPDLDGDFIPDALDSDRDGDGFENDTEVDLGTDPDNAQDYPDVISPTLSVNTVAPMVDIPSIMITGTAQDEGGPRAGIQFLQIVSDRYPDTAFSGQLDATGAFSIEVPLQLDTNNLTVELNDLSGNTASESLVVQRTSAPRIVNVTPVDGSVSIEPTLLLKGDVATYLPPERLTFTINESRLSLVQDNVSGLYRFELPNVPLNLGLNTFTLRVESDNGDDTYPLTVNYLPENAESLPAPSIELVSPADGALLSDDAFNLVARISSSAGPLSVTVDGLEVLGAEDGEVFYVVKEFISFAQGSDQRSVQITATDTLSKQSEATLTVYRDGTGPVITLDGGFEPSTVINTVVQSSLSLSGTVSDASLSSFLINGQAVSLLPGANDATFLFSVQLPIALAATETVVLQAYDRAGNKTEIEYLFENNAVADIALLQPVSTTQLITEQDEITGLQTSTLDVVAELTSSGSESVTARWLSGSVVNNEQAIEVPFAVNGSLAAGQITRTLAAPATAVNDTLIVELRNASGDILASDQVAIELLPASAVPVALERIEPANNTEYVEPNAAIELYFNRNIDLALLTLQVNETLNGLTYINTAELGQDFIDPAGYELQEVNRNFQPVVGQIVEIPGGTGVSFTPNQHYGFNAELFVDIIYDGEQLARTRFQVRELPTFIDGAVADQFGQPLAGITVELPELGRSTVTNGDGGFAFGYQETGEQVISGGKHRLLINDGFGNSQFGTVNTNINVQRNYPNELSRFVLQELKRDIPFAQLRSGEVNTLLNGDLTLDLGSATALFSNGRDQGPVHAQFLPFEHLGVQTWPAAIPTWAFGLQPKGIELIGEVGITLKLPMLRGSYSYIPVESYPLVILLGYNQDGQVLEPIGVGEVVGNEVRSVGKVKLDCLDFIAIAQIPPDQAQPVIDYGNGEISLFDMKAQLNTGNP